MPADLRISVVMPTLGRTPALAQSLDALARQTLDRASFELVLAEDAAAEVPPAPPALPFVVTRLRAERAGASAARNAGWRAAQAPLVLFLGDDIVASPQLLAEHLGWHERNPQDETGVLGSVEWARSLRRDAFMRWLDAGIQFDYGSIDGTRAGAGHFYTANVSLKRVMLERTGGFDEKRFPFLYEDIDLGVRLFEHGFSLLYNRDAAAEHLHQPRLEEWRERMRLVGAAERRWSELRPGERPYFHGLFADAVSRPVASGRGRFLTGVVPAETPWLGPRTRTSTDLYFRQQLADAFLGGWEQAGNEMGTSSQ
jgi:GT2 family glycosyltransferase